MKVLFHFNASPALEVWLRARLGPGDDLTICPEADETRFLAMLPDVDVIWHVLKPLTAAE